jgi:hypothetical protein
MRGTARKTNQRTGRIPAQISVEAPAARKVGAPHIGTAGMTPECTPCRIDVSPFDESAVAPQAPAQEPTGKFKHWSQVLGVVGTLVVHALVLQTVGGPWFGHKAQPREPQGIGSVREPAHAPPSEALVLLNLDSSQKGGSDLGRSVAALMPPSIKPRIDVVIPESIVAIDAPDEGGSSNPTTEVGDPAVLALMAGRYRGQISARIERAWIRPRTAVGDPGGTRSAGSAESAAAQTKFTCQVQIRQDTRGNVEEVLLLACNGSEPWRRSLIAGIYQASPLPAPPAQAVFSKFVTMTFEAYQYAPGRVVDDYEANDGESQAPIQVRPGTASVTPASPLAATSTRQKAGSLWATQKFSRIKN